MNAEQAQQALRARKFLELHQGPKTLLLPNAWDVKNLTQSTQERLSSPPKRAYHGAPMKEEYR